MTGRPLPPDAWRAHFPALAQEVGGQPLAYLDSAATTLRPRAVIDAVADFAAHDDANPGAALHTLARRAHERLEDARRVVAAFINAAEPAEVVFTRGTTEALNLVAAAWGGANLRPGDEILIGMAEHASNMAPWQLLARRTGAALVTFRLDEHGWPDEEDIAAVLGPRTRIVAFSHVSNVLGMLNPARRLCALARAPGRIVVVDAAQSVPHVPVDVQALGCDFLAFSGHKMLAPTGVGVLWGRRALLDAMPPWQGGSNMTHDLTLDTMPLADGAHRFGAGTPNAWGAVGLAAAIRWLTDATAEARWQHERALTRRLLEHLGAIRGIRVLGSAEPGMRIAVCSFTVEGVPAPDVVRALDAVGIAVRGGDLASRPLLEHFGTARALRASCYVYTTLDEVDRLADALEAVATGRYACSG